MPRHRMVTGVVFLVLGVLLAGVAAAQTGSPALTGKVTAGQDVLEGVLVSAKKNGSTITVTVVSDKDGHYSFPPARLDPGPYSLRLLPARSEPPNVAPLDTPSAHTPPS